MIPFAVVGSERNLIVDGKTVRGRKTRWGVVNVEDEAHCEFVYLRNFLTRCVFSLSVRIVRFSHTAYNLRQDTPARPHRDDGADPLRGVPLEAAARAQGADEPPRSGVRRAGCAPSICLLLVTVLFVL